ncbi:unnamed protein product [Cuscuta campestris]|uniref:Uncharacterized protein n=1 Tax=Cuscuta campestris TaxID=132261 RepID=A0A484LLP0_9ASTE|nr:unnamed protein product [Cuscuta campestris]
MLRHLRRLLDPQKLPEAGGTLPQHSFPGQAGSAAPPAFPRDSGRWGSEGGQLRALFLEKAKRIPYVNSLCKGRGSELARVPAVLKGGDWGVGAEIGAVAWI